MKEEAPQPDSVEENDYNAQVMPMNRRKSKIGARPLRIAPTTVRKVLTRRERNRRNNGNSAPRELPAGTTAHSLHFPERRGTADGRLQETSPWYQSIIDPLHGADCKIPDDVGDETGTLQLVLRDTVTVNATAQPTCGVKTNTIYPCQIDLALQGYSQLTSASTSSAPVWGNGASYATTKVLQSYAQGVRVVSAGLYVQPECSLSNCSGEMTFFVRPMRYFQVGPNYSEYLNMYGSTTFALNTVEPMMIRWFPYSRIQQTFAAFYDPNASSVGITATSVPGWELGFITSGVPSGVTFRVTIAINYEFLPLHNSVNILDAAPSPSDITEMDLVEGWVANAPVAHTITEEQISEPPSVVEPKHGEEESGFGMFTDVLTELLPVALEGLALFL